MITKSMINLVHRALTQEDRWMTAQGLLGNLKYSGIDESNLFRILNILIKKKRVKTATIRFVYATTGYPKRVYAHYDMISIKSDFLEE